MKKNLLIIGVLIIATIFVLGSVQYIKKNETLKVEKIEKRKYIVYSLEEGRALVQKMINTDDVSNCKKIVFGGVDMSNAGKTIQGECVTSFAVAKNNPELCSSLGHPSTVSFCEYKVKDKNPR